MTNSKFSNQVIAFVSMEADMLDHKEYREWLQLWMPDGHYVVPIDVDETDFANTLNFAYDDAAMRELRVMRLLNGESVSSMALDRTVRSVSRFRILEESDTTVKARCAMFLSEIRHGTTLTYPADVEYLLVKEGGSFKIQQKTVRLLNAGSHLRTVAFIF